MLIYITFLFPVDVVTSCFVLDFSEKASEVAEFGSSILRIVYNQNKYK